MDRTIVPSLKRLADFNELEMQTLKELKDSKNPKIQQLEQTFLKQVDRKIISVSNLKGGVGKSTISNILQAFIPNSVILNIDLNQNAKKINASSGKTINFVGFHLKGYELQKIIEITFSDYDTIIIDSPGENSKELLSIIEDIDHMIIPMAVGDRSSLETEMFINTLFLQKDFKSEKLSFIINNFRQQKHAEHTIQRLEVYMQEKHTDKNYKVFLLPSTDVIFTMEKQKKSISELCKSNSGAYRVAHNKILTLVHSIQDYYENELEV